ncbi:receptor-type tyrosine-protein phosphatase U-like [Salvelinus sp. IW2-2015]|uniref:receptor-type tyrosine-protein phosphatase U-like n=1 Tax=Salvelinus sp. IW2-2015 TaxID=2691554 RepID=UPI000CEACCEC|nr:receptor-type tyrosine-protein phosphatase U-like [Salvelinus alpinus]
MPSITTSPLFLSPTAGCTFDEDSDPGLCEYKQGQEDDFDWQLMRTYNWPHTSPDLLRGSFMMVNSSQHAAGQRAHLLLHSLSENDTHCIQFSYFLYSRDGHSPGDLQLYIRVNGGLWGSAVWNVSGSHGRQWHQVELAVSTFWPSEYQRLLNLVKEPQKDKHSQWKMATLTATPTVTCAVDTEKHQEVFNDCRDIIQRSI